MEEIVNKVAQSNLKVLDLADYSDSGERVFFDLKDLLFNEMILKEQDFRDFISGHDWSEYAGKNIAVGCSTDAIIPAWAYMLVVSKLEPYARRIVTGNLESLENEIFREELSKLSTEDFKDAKVMVKGCGDVKVPDFAFAEITRILMPVASSIMYGEPCSSVPIFKRKK